MWPQLGVCSCGWTPAARLPVVLEAGGFHCIIKGQRSMFSESRIAGDIVLFVQSRLCFSTVSLKYNIYLKTEADNESEIKSERLVCVLKDIHCTYMWEYLSLCIYVLSHHVNFWKWKMSTAPYKQAWLAMCVCVRTMCSALAGQCSVQCRSEQRRPGQRSPSTLVIPAFSGALARTWWAWARKRLRSLVYFSLSLPLFLSLTLLFPLFFSCSPPPPRPLEPLCEWMDSKCLLSNSVCHSVPLYFSGSHQKEEEGLERHHQRV